MSLQTKIKLVSNVLVSVSKNCYHYTARNPKLPYVVWSEDGPGGYLSADNGMAESAIHGTVDIYSKKEFDSVFDDVFNAMNESDRITCVLKSVQFEDDSNVIHYEYEFEVC